MATAVAGGPGQQPDGTRDALVSAAIDSLREDGYAGSTAAAIAARAGCTEELAAGYFGSVNALLVAALDEVSRRRMAGYLGYLAGADSIASLAAAARQILVDDMDAGYVRVLVEMITAAHSVPEIGPHVAELMEPWRELTEQAVRRSLGRSPAARLLPPPDAARALVGMFLGLELLASLDDDREAALQVLDKTGALAKLLDMVVGLRLPGVPGGPR